MRLVVTGVGFLLVYSVNHECLVQNFHWIIYLWHFHRTVHYHFASDHIYQIFYCGIEKYCKNTPCLFGLFYLYLWKSNHGFCKYVEEIDFLIGCAMIIYSIVTAKNQTTIIFINFKFIFVCTVIGHFIKFLNFFKQMMLVVS